MVRAAFPRIQVVALAFAVLAAGGWRGARADSEPLSGAVADAVLWGRPMPDAERTKDLPKRVQEALSEYRARERAFQSALKPPPGVTDEEQALLVKRIGIERVVFSLFARKDSARVAAGYALDADLDGGARFIDELLRDLPVKWLAPYLNLVAGHLKLCADQPDDARRQLVVAREGGHPLIRISAQYLIETGTCMK